MFTDKLLKKASIDTMSYHLMILRGERSQEKMAEICAMSLRHYSDMERRCCAASSMTLVNLYAAGMDLNGWAEDVLILYDKLCKNEKEEV